MKRFNAYTLEGWPRVKSGELIFQSTEDAIYYANLVDDRLAAYDLLKKWTKKTEFNINLERFKSDPNLNRVYDLAVRAQHYRECIEEIQRLNKEGK